MNLVDLLLGMMSDPLLYSIIFLVYVILAVIILPIPVEIGLFNPFIHPLILITILAFGKGIGALLVFLIGLKIRTYFERILIKRYDSEFICKITDKITSVLEPFIIRYGYMGLYLVMSIPLMMDSCILYLFSLLNIERNEKRVFTKGKFVSINMLAGATRGSIVLGVMFLCGVKLI